MVKQSKDALHWADATAERIVRQRGEPGPALCMQHSIGVDLAGPALCHRAEG